MHLSHFQWGGGTWNILYRVKCIRKRKINIIFKCINTKCRKMSLFTGQQWRNRHREYTYGHGERGGEVEMYRRSNMETYTTVCKIESQWEFAIWLKKLKQGLYINLEGWNGEGDGREAQKGGDIILMADSCGGLTENDKIL